ncbi:MAG: hypothetical protein NZ699_19190 [Roseiflexus sp.]|nr:hypothetical protein [Roseiflexus sp.]MDW8145568.1 hypothetical protein [Roseiflexaceae bacterium]
MTIVLLDTNVVSYKGDTRALRIAATALRHRIPLVTHNPGDFQHIAGLDVRSIINS